MDHDAFNPKGHQGDRKLRILAVILTVPSFILLIAAGAVTGKFLPTIGLLPTALSCAINIQVLIQSRKGPSSYNTLVDMLAALALMAVMIPSWIFLAESWDIYGNALMLDSYAMMPMMVNFCIHTYLSLTNLPLLFRPRSCPNCNHTMPSVLPRWQRGGVALPTNENENENQTSQRNIYSDRRASEPQTTNAPQTHNTTATHAAGPGHSRSSKEIYQPGIMRAYADQQQAERESSEFQTSGFNTPRQSAETLGSEARESREEVLRVIEGGSQRKDGGGSLV